MIDAGTADEQGYGVGDSVKIATLKPVQDFRVSGVAQYGSVSSLGTATFAVFTIPTAQQLLDREGSSMRSRWRPQTASPPSSSSRTSSRFFRQPRRSRTGVEEAEEAASEVSEFTSFIRYFLLAFGAVALFVGAFVIFNTMSITVAQRTRELATLRTIGASSEADPPRRTSIGLIASIIGFFLGVGLAYGVPSTSTCRPRTW